MCDRRGRESHRGQYLPEGVEWAAGGAGPGGCVSVSTHITLVGLCLPIPSESFEFIHSACLTVPEVFAAGGDADLTVATSALIFVPQMMTVTVIRITFIPPSYVPGMAPLLT